MFEVGRSYKTVGGWEAKIIWRSVHTLVPEFISYCVVHKPYSGNEAIIIHSEDGKCYSSFTVPTPPLYDVPHPAWLTNIEIV